jgi:hypothetical protein
LGGLAFSFSQTLGFIGGFRASDDPILVRRMRVEISAFHKNLAPYFPSPVIHSLFNSAKFSARFLRTIDPVAGQVNKTKFEEIRDDYDSFRQKGRFDVYYIQQKWEWTEAAEPPQIAIDFNI